MLFVFLLKNMETYKRNEIKILLEMLLYSYR